MSRYMAEQAVPAGRVRRKQPLGGYLKSNIQQVKKPVRL